ncbi:glycerol-3-phosphate acyltransferase [Opitutus sp. ER46]|uniref:glycerol-3-phosphate acyltransferase n=1 Tax=Opitutus sp. ER46 TaxID=2161864 RepID=UPI000D301A7A|nr:glycerol-3-phosphate acyltransferase [Opitutus sp. ER46]PTX91358.1 glycerol-3-phosphate acyltransferase [Opitutus sp. ER46]
MLIVALCVGYALGCLSPGWLLVRRATGQDLRQTGSGGTGATNAARVLGGRAFLLVMALDALKAAAAVLLARWLAPETPWHVLAMPAAVAGHIWPAPLRFKGGKGAAPLLGGAVALNPFFLVAAAIPAAIAAVFVRRTFVLTTAAAAGGIASAAWLLPGTPERVAFAATVGLVLLAHRSHFVRASGPAPS